MKKLMILGGTINIVPVIEKAHELGIYVITCDFEPDNVAHKYSDEYCFASTTDKEAVLKNARRCAIDGIISFACDTGVVTAAYVAEKMNLPFQCSYRSAQILQDKGLFRQFLKEHDFNVPRAKRYTDKRDAFDDKFDFPVIVKPVDSAGSKGVNRVDSLSELEDAIDMAVEYSHSGAFIIEQFLTFKGYHSDTDAFTYDGHIGFISYSDQLFDKTAANPYEIASIIWPTTMEEGYQQELTEETQRLFGLLEMKSGIYNIETCVGNDGKGYLMEVSPRGGGSRIAELQKIVYGVDLIEKEIKSALGLPLGEFKSHPIDGVWCEFVIHPKADETGIFKDIVIDDKIKKKYITKIEMSICKGEKIVSHPGVGNTIGDIFLHCDTREELDKIIENADKWLQIEFEETI
jgi:biotin carboxylase